MLKSIRSDSGFVGEKMGAGIHSRDVPEGAKILPADTSKWSDKSRQSYSAGDTWTYQDKSYQCWKCRAIDVFTAEQQKHAFEVRKVHCDQQRVLCRVCFRERMQLEKEARECRDAWACYRLYLNNDFAFLSRWLQCLETLPRYAGPSDAANVTMIRKRLSRLQA